MNYNIRKENYKGLTIKIQSDDDPENPREWDNVGTLVCWHRRYTLGDEQPKQDPEEYLAALADKYLGDLPDRIERIQHHFPAGSLYLDRSEKYEDEARAAALEKNILQLPLYLYDHSGITISTSPFSCPWDSGQVGFIYVSLERALHEWGREDQRHLGWDGLANYTFKPDGSPRTLREAATSYLIGEVRDYDDYLTGNVAGYVVETEDGDEVASCWGFYPDHTPLRGRDKWEDALSEARSAADSYLEEQNELDTQLCLNI